MFSRIFVPLDGSDIAAQALPYAIALTEKLGSHLSLAGVVLPHLKDLGVADLFGITSDTRRTAEEHAAVAAVDYLQGIAAPLRARGMDVEWTIARGENAAGEIIDLAAEEDHTLIVMSTHGRTGFQRLRLGSVAQQVIRHAAEPTLVVRARENPLRAGMSLVQQITVTLDGSPLAECALPVACRFAEAFAVPLTLLRVLPNAVYRSTYYGTTFVPPTKELEEYAQSDAEMYLARIAARLEVTGVRTRWLRGRAAPDAIITEYLHAQPPGIAVMASHGRGGISRWVIGSTAENVITGAPCPVLIVRAMTAPHDGRIPTEEVGARSVKESVRRG
jgi:nucleotide-binding universal stress UspA family protein